MTTEAETGVMLPQAQERQGPRGQHQKLEEAQMVSPLEPPEGTGTADTLTLDLGLWNGKRIPVVSCGHLHFVAIYTAAPGP